VTFVQAATDPASAAAAIVALITFILRVGVVLMVCSFALRRPSLGHAHR
jgi:hypothetical protein